MLHPGLARTTPCTHVQSPLPLVVPNVSDCRVQMYTRSDGLIALWPHTPDYRHHWQSQCTILTLVGIRGQVCCLTSTDRACAIVLLLHTRQPTTAMSVHFMDPCCFLVPRDACFSPVAAPLSDQAAALGLADSKQSRLHSTF